MKVVRRLTRELWRWGGSRRTFPCFGEDNLSRVSCTALKAKAHAQESRSSDADMREQLTDVFSCEESK